MSDPTPRDLTDEEINEAGPEATKQASSPLYATKTPSPDPEIDDVDTDERSED